MTLNQKSLKFNYHGSVLLNLSIYFFISSLIYYLLSLNITLLKLGLLFSCFILVFYLSSKRMGYLLQKMQLKNIMVISKFLLGLITITTAVLIYNKLSLNSLYLYLLILTTAILHAVLNRAYNVHYQKVSTHEALQTRELIFKFNLEKLLIVILAAATAAFIEIYFIPFILTATAVYYFLSAYINTFQKI